VPKEVAATASPRGYTRSLVLFLAPIAALLGWFARHPEVQLARRALVWTLGLLLPTGIALDFLLAERLLRFEHWETTLGIPFPVVGGVVPIEELLFYLAGFVAVLLTYVWADEHWLSRYNIPDYAARAGEVPALLRWDWRAVYAGAAIAAMGTAWKAWVVEEPGLPLYLYYLVAVAVVPTAALLGSTVAFVNWQAFSFTYLAILLVSLVWEVTLAMPYGWWDYQPQSMTGIAIAPWWGLPLEAVLVWLVVTYTTVVTYEAVKIWLASGKPLRTTLLGARRER
jgi:hypothetical protein